MGSKPINICWIKTYLSQTENHVLYRITDNFLQIIKNPYINTSFVSFAPRGEAKLKFILSF